MIPTLDTNDIHDQSTVGVPRVDGSGGTGLNSSVSGSGGTRLATGGQGSPRTLYLTSPRETLSLPSAHLTRRAADVATVLEMNPLQCHGVADLQRKLIETAEWVVKLRHWYIHQLQERDAWYESRLKVLEDSFHAALAAATAAGTVHATAGAGAAYTITGRSSTEKGAHSTVSYSRVAGNGASESSTIAATISGSAEKGADGGARLRHRSRAHKNSGVAPSVAGFSNGDIPCPMNPNPSSSMGTDAAVAGGGRSADRGSSAPLQADHPKRSVFVPTLRGRRTTSAGAARRQPLLPKDNESLRTGVAAAAVDWGELRLTLSTRAVAAIEPMIVEGNDDSVRTLHHPSQHPHPRDSGAGRLSPSSTTQAQVISTPKASTFRVQRDMRSATTPRTGRPSSANGLLLVGGAATESSDRFSARTGESGDRRGGDAQMERRRYNISLPHVRPSRAHTSLPHYLQDLDAGIPRDATAAGTGTVSGAADNVACGPHETASRVSSHLYLFSSGDSNSRNPKRRSFSCGGIRRVSRLYTTSGTEQKNSARGVCGPHPKRTGRSEASGQSSRSRFISDQASE
ncbi:hypothetical protein JIQ42_07735 [Leishmania sp. Namibia]|uniref:hypothetical protein n=1 Tax=Leishmania sp. Namibia TaxID=2802991 RepID=UPI001B6A0DFD|nr:hypothetical protein JIQ42_07735 [Leishmania sp. Namibia]